MEKHRRVFLDHVLTNDKFNFENVIVYTDAENTQVVIEPRLADVTPDVLFAASVFLTDMMRHVNLNIAERMTKDIDENRIKLNISRLPRTYSSPLAEKYVVSIKKN